LNINKGNYFYNANNKKKPAKLMTGFPFL